MIGCMVESQLAVAPAAHIGSLADWVDLDGHLLLAEQPFVGLELRDGARAALGRARARGRAGVSERLAIFAEGLFESHSGKTAHGVIRYGNRDVVAVVDSTNAGRTAAEIEPFCVRDVPVVATRGRGDRARRHDAADRRGPDRRQARPGVAPGAARGDRGRASTWRPASTPSCPPTRSCARPPSGAAPRLRDLRAAPPDLTVPLGPASRAAGVRVVHSVGSDTVIGKKVVTLELDRAARERGLASVYVPTGQTGVAIAGWGLAVDHVISDYVAGAAERLVNEGSERGDLLFVEGQGAIFHPAYSGRDARAAPRLGAGRARAGAQGRGHRAAQLPGPAARSRCPLWCPPTRRSPGPVRPARVAAVALNTSTLDEDAARAAVAEAESATGLPADDVVRFGADRVLDAVLAAHRLDMSARERSSTID